MTRSGLTLISKCKVCLFSPRSTLHHLLLCCPARHHGGAPIWAWSCSKWYNRCVINKDHLIWKGGVWSSVLVSFLLDHHLIADISPPKHLSHPGTLVLCPPPCPSYNVRLQHQLDWLLSSNRSCPQHSGPDHKHAFDLPVSVCKVPAFCFIVWVCMTKPVTPCGTQTFVLLHRFQCGAVWIFTCWIFSSAFPYCSVMVRSNNCSPMSNYAIIMFCSTFVQFLWRYWTFLHEITKMFNLYFFKISDLIPL